MKKDFLRDEKGKVRNCVSNTAKMNIFEYWMYIGVPFSIDFKAYFMALGMVFIMPFVLIFYPVLAIIDIKKRIKRDKKWYELSTGKRGNKTPC